VGGASRRFARTTCPRVMASDSSSTRRSAMAAAFPASTGIDALNNIRMNLLSLEFGFEYLLFAAAQSIADGGLSTPLSVETVAPRANRGGGGNLPKGCGTRDRYFARVTMTNQPAMARNATSRIILPRGRRLSANNSTIGTKDSTILVSGILTFFSLLGSIDRNAIIGVSQIGFGSRQDVVALPCCSCLLSKHANDNIGEHRSHLAVPLHLDADSFAIYAQGFLLFLREHIKNVNFFDPLCV
jgi:hypothetical protein